MDDQNTEYYKNYVEIKEQNELLKNQLNDRSSVESLSGTFLSAAYTILSEKKAKKYRLILPKQYTTVS